MDGCNVLPETQFVGTRLHADAKWVLFVGYSWGAAGERSEFICNQNDHLILQNDMDTISSSAEKWLIKLDIN